jgi:hypothetical protein
VVRAKIVLLAAEGVGLAAETAETNVNVPEA